MAEPNSGAPFRHVIDWQNPDFTDWRKIEAEATRVFDICHGCRRCFNLCDSFPRLFDMIDATPSGELDEVPKARYREVVDACTLCDMCFMTKCPYVPPHAFDLDFPHLMLRYRAAQLKDGVPSLADRQLVATDRNGKLGSALNPLANWAVGRGNGLTRPLMEAAAGIDRNAALPTFDSPTFVGDSRKHPAAIDHAAPAAGRKAVLYATCFVNYNNTAIGKAARAVLAKNGVETEVLHPECCGMPQLEMGDLADVAGRAATVAAFMKPWIEKGYRIVALIPSCALMLKFEWPLIVPDNPDVALLSRNTSDLSEYVVDIARKEGLAPGLKPLEGGVTLHLACHARAQNMGHKGAEMLRLIPEPDVAVVERCSGHGGAWGVKKGNFETALKVGKPVARQAASNQKTFVASECPLAATHILQGMEGIDGAALPEKAHPIELLARAYGLGGERLMSEAARRLTREDILPMAEYGRIRAEQRRRMAEAKRLRRVEVGPYATFYFENYHTMWHQVHEMLFVEKGGDAQIQDELDAYNPLIPNGDELVATVMFEIDEPRRREAALHALGGIEHHMVLSVGGPMIGGTAIRGQPDTTRENTSPEGKASSVQFVRFALNPDQKHAFADAAVPVTLGFDHPHYSHLATIPAVRQTLTQDLQL